MKNILALMLLLMAAPAFSAEVFTAIGSDDHSFERAGEEALDIASESCGYLPKRVSAWKLYRDKKSALAYKAQANFSCKDSNEPQNNRELFEQMEREDITSLRPGPIPGPAEPTTTREENRNSRAMENLLREERLRGGHRRP